MKSKTGSGRAPFVAAVLSVALLAALGGILLANTVLRSAGSAPGATATRPGASGTSPAPVSTSNSPTTSSPGPESPSPQAATFTILAGGDVLPHGPVMNSARSNSGYNFRPLLAGLDEWVAGADLSLCHMEVPVAPAGKKITTYPIFGTTPDLVRDLAAQGWSGCSTASNHSVDRGFAGVVETLQTFEKYGLGHVGTARSAKEAAAPQWYTVTVNNTATRIAHFSASYGTNGMPVDPDKPWSIQLLDAKQLISHAREARKAGADLVLVSVHDGAEYVTEPTASQRSIAKALADSGAVDLMIGHHAHVPQPLAKLPGGPGGNGMWVAYGLGNMLSNQDQACCVANTANGLLLLATVSKAPSGPAQITQFEWVATTVDRKAGHRLSALADLSGSKSGSLSAAEIAKRYELVRKAAGSQVPERTTPPEQQESAVTVSKRPPGITPEP